MSPSSEADLKAAADLVQATWRHFQIGPRDSRNHRRIAECTHCRGTCANPRTERLQAHLLRFCKEISVVIREEYRQFCDSLAVTKSDAVMSSSSMTATQVTGYGALNESSAAALGKSFQTTKLQLLSSHFQVDKSSAQSATSSVSTDEAISSSGPDMSHRCVSSVSVPSATLLKWSHMDHFELVMVHKGIKGEMDSESSNRKSDTSAASFTSAKTSVDGGDNGGSSSSTEVNPVTACSETENSQCNFTCRYCREEFVGTAPLKDHILYACSTVPREKLSRLVESELTAPV